MRGITSCCCFTGNTVYASTVLQPGIGTTGDDFRAVTTGTFVDGSIGELGTTTKELRIIVNIGTAQVITSGDRVSDSNICGRSWRRSSIWNPHLTAATSTVQTSTTVCLRIGFSCVEVTAWVTWDT